MNILEQRWSSNDKLDNFEDTIASRFERQVKAVPDQLAIVTDEILLTYRALDLKASRIAAALASLSCPHDQPIMLFMRDEAARIAAMLGVAKAGRIFIPLASSSPEQWITQVVEDSGTTQIIVDSSTHSIAERAAAGSVTVVEIEQIARPFEPFVLDRTASPDDTAYVVYTSGSTGQPKGVANSHRNMIRMCDVRSLLAGVVPSDRYANLRPSGVGAEIRNSLTPLFCGACLFRFDLPRRGLQKLAPWLLDKQITAVSLSCSLLRAWLASLPDDLRFPALRFVDASSERLYAQDIIRLSRHLEGDWCIGHSYASAECGTIASQVFTSSSLPDAGIVAVGRPVDGAEVSLRDETGALIQPGEIGEIVVRSQFLAKGYWNHRDLTAKVFQTDPIDSAIRTYQTGDLGRWRSDGTLDLVGRKGGRIRLRGYNIEPFNVECELLRQPGVADAVVLLRDGTAGQEQCLVGYVVAPPTASPSLMRQRLAEHLPSYMVPSSIIVLDSFPIAQSGKIDRNALPPPDRDEVRQLEFRAPTDDREQELLTIWQEVLEIPNIGIDDDFFDLGGNSLQILMLFAEIEVRLGINLSPTTILQAPTIARLAALIRAVQGVVATPSLVPLRASGTGLPLFLVGPAYYGAMYYRHLLKDLKSDRPVFGLQLPPLDGKHRIPRTIESMAADYVAEIRRVQPHGPYFLAGYSFAGRVSFEIAHQLVREGERVDFVGLIDTGCRNAPVEKKWTLMSEPVRLSLKVRRANGLRDLFLRGRGFISREVRWGLLSPRLRLLDLRLRQGRSVPDEQRFTYWEWLCRRASRRHVFKPYPGHITIFSSAGNSKWRKEDWGPLARGGLTVLEVPAGHGDMASPPHSKLLAEHFDACLSASLCKE